MAVGMSDKRTHPSSPRSHGFDPATRPGLNGPSQELEPVDDRSCGRYLMGGAVTCNVGRLVNLSTQGALVISRSPLGTTVPFVVSDGACRVVCEAKVLRTRCMGLHRHSCALQFGELRAEEQAGIEHMIARHHIARHDASSGSFRDAA
jgi:hypothetical protein